MNEGAGMGPEEPTGAPGPPMAPPAPYPQNSPRRNLLIAGIASVAVLAGVAAFILFALRGTKDVLVEMVPSSAIGYVTAYLDPAAEQKVKLRNLAGKFPAFGNSGDLSRRIDEALDDGLSAIGLNAADVRPWLGSQIGVAVRFTGVEEPATAFMIRSKDDAAARRALDKFRHGPVGSKDTWMDEQYGGVTLSSGSNSEGEVGAYALLEHTVISSNDPKFLRDVVDAQQGKIDDLGSSAAFRDATAALPDGKLGLAYFSLGSFLDPLKGLLGAAGAADVQGLDQIEALRAMALSVSAKSDGVGADLTVLVDRSKLTANQRQLLAEGGQENAALAFTPESAYGVIAMTGFRGSIDELRQRASREDPSLGEADVRLGLSDAIRHLTGDSAIEVRPGASGFPGGAWLIGTDDEATMQRLLDRAADMLLADAPGAPTAVRHESYRGVDIAALEVAVPELARFGIQPAYAVSDGMAIIGSSPAEVRAALDAKRGSSLTGGERFREVVAEVPGDRRFLVYVDVQAISAAIRTALDPDALEEFDREVAPNLTPVRRFILNSDIDEDRAAIRMFVLIQ